jgi:hypothetical protein
VVTFNRTDLEFILTQIKMAEAGQPPVNVHLAFGLRTVDGWSPARRTSARPTRPSPA